MDKITKSFGARFGTGISSRQGIVQDLNRNVMLGTLSHTRRLSTPLPSGSKTLGPRKLHNSQWGFVCPSESPDGGNVGIIELFLKGSKYDIIPYKYNRAIIFRGNTFHSTKSVHMKPGDENRRVNYTFLYA